MSERVLIQKLAALRLDDELHADDHWSVADLLRLSGIAERS
jgi:hypothetical protein